MQETALQKHQAGPLDLDLDRMGDAFAQIKKFQQLVKSQLVKDHDYGTIPGTQKPTLLKPGAEKITKLMGLADSYEITEKVEDWDRPLFSYTVACQLSSIQSGTLISQGIGHCNSMESRYRYRWAWPSDVPAHLDKTSLPQRQINTRRGKSTQYKVENDDIYSLTNTILKMSKKRALVDAALSAGRLSDLFSQGDNEPDPQKQSHPGPVDVDPPTISAEKQEVLAQIREDLVRMWPNRTADDQKAKSELFSHVFNKSTWDEVCRLPLDVLKCGAESIAERVAIATEPSSQHE
ncbi:hypothetical protein ACFL6U_12810 [Planctomycetota bacterium]